MELCSPWDALHDHRIMESILNLSYTDLIALVSRKSISCSPNSKKSRRVFRRPIDCMLHWPFATVPPRLILFNSCQNDYTWILMGIKLHPEHHIFIPQSCPSVPRILEAPIIPFTYRRSVVPSILNLSDTDFHVLLCRKSYESCEKSKKLKCLICCRIDGQLD